MEQNIENQHSVGTQLNIADNKGDVYFAKPSRLAGKFKKLKDEIQKGVLLDKFIEDFEDYNTVLDGKSMPEKLKDGGFSNAEIERAARRKQQYWKKCEKNKYYEYAQRIDIELLAIIKHNFETYVEPLIESSAGKREIIQALDQFVITPISNLLNTEGYDDDFLNYSIDDILGMVFFLTGKCQLNWKIYESDI